MQVRIGPLRYVQVVEVVEKPGMVFPGQAAGTWTSVSQTVPGVGVSVGQFLLFLRGCEGAVDSFGW